MSLSDISSKLQEVRTKTSSANPLSSSVSGVESGTKSVTSAINQMKTAASSAVKQTSTLTSKVGNALGGSNDVAAKAVATSGSGDSGNSPGNRLGKFSTDPTSTLPTLDPLKRDVSTPFEGINDLGKSVTDYMGKSTAGTKLGKGWDSLSSIVGSAKSTGASLMSRIESSIDMVGSVASLPDSVLREVTNVINTAQQFENGYKALVDGVQHTFSSLKALADFQTVSSWLKMYSSADREATTVDVAATKSIIMAMAASLTAEGMMAKLEELIATIKDDATKADIYDELIKQGAKLGSLAAVEYYQAKLYSGHASIVVKTVVKNLLTNYKPASGATSKDVGARMVAVFNKLSSTWNIGSNAARVEISTYTVANANALAALATTSHRPYAAAGATIKTMTPKQMIAKYFS